MKLSKILDLLEYRISEKNDIEISGISFSSNKINKGNLFIAVKGNTTDGAMFIDKAISNGAASIIYDERSIINNDIKNLCIKNNIPILKVKNPEIEAARISRLFYPNTPKNIYAVTGTNGKTTIANFTQQLLNLLGINDTATIGTMGFNVSNSKFQKLSDEINLMIGKNPLTTQDIITNHKILNMIANNGINNLIMEASSDGIARHRLDEINFTACAISNLSTDHLITHGTMKDYLMVKMQLFDKLPIGGTAIFNTDNEYSDQFKKYILNLNNSKNLDIIEYGKNVVDIQHGIKLQNYSYNNGKYDLEIVVFGTLYKTQLNLIGDFQIYNALNALAFVLSDRSINVSKAVNAIKYLKTVNGRMELVATTKTGAKVYIDYAHNSEALKNALIQLRQITKNKLISVSGISSGKSTERYETAKIAGDLADIVIFTYLSPRSEDVNTIIEKQQKIYPQGLHGGKTRYDAIKKAIDMAEDGDTILINGQGHEKFIIEYGKPVPFYDCDAVIKIISES